MFKKVLKKYFNGQISIPKEVNKVEFYICQHSSHYGLDGDYKLEVTKEKDSAGVLEALIKTVNVIKHSCQTIPQGYFGKDPDFFIRRPKNDKDTVTLFIESNEGVDKIYYSLLVARNILYHYKQGLESKL